ncbi:uncharacterized protein TNCV_1349701 [Trichonephila clavipes]|nr:uncharacterized protein TNCV_1349701 [Trichonephila clavipes]
MRGHGSLVVKASDRGWRIMSSIRVPFKTSCVGERCTLNLLRAQTFSRWCGVVVRREGSASSGDALVSRPWFKITKSVTKSPRVAEQCAVNIHSPIKMLTKIFKSYSLIILSITGVRFVIDHGLEMI